MVDESVYYSDVQNEFDAAVEQGRRRKYFKRFTWFFLIVAIVAGIFVLMAYRYRKPIDLEHATPDKQAAWLAVQDFSAEEPATQEKLFDMYIGKVTVPDAEKVGTSTYALPGYIEKLAWMFMGGRDDKVVEWRATHERLPVLRVDYVFDYDKNSKSAFITSRDVKPGPALKKRWEERRAAMKQGKVAKTPLVEKNVQLLIFQWFVAKYKYYDAAPDKKKKAALNAVVADVNNFQAFYNDLRAKAGMPKLTRAQMLGEMDMTVDSWLELVSVEELAKVLWFKDLVVSIVVAQTAAPNPANTNGDSKNAGNAEPPKKPVPGENTDIAEKIRNWLKR